MTPSPVPARFDWRPPLILAAAAAACLLPFVGKPFHIDDPLFVWAARHIAGHPFDPFGFQVHWYSTWEPMSDVTQNPPLGCYYLALAGSLCGWDEVCLHLSMLLPAWGLLWGTYRLAERAGAPPLPAALLTLTTPAALVCGTSVMCDVAMLCLWVWAVLVWDRGLRGRHAGRLYLAAGLIVLATLTKYFGLSLVPLLAVYSYAVDRSDWRRWTKALVAAVLVLAVYQAAFLALYGRGGLAGAMGYAVVVGARSAGGEAFQLFEGLGFVGGCVGAAALLATALLPWRGLLAAILVAATAVAVGVYLPTTTVSPGGLEVYDSPFYQPDGGDGPGAAVMAQFAVWTAAGVGVLLLTVLELWARRDAFTLLLALWVAGTTVFATYVNWALNGRSVLPLVPPIAVLLARRLSGAPRWAWPAVLLPAAALALIAAHADVRAAEADRAAARRVVAEWAPPPGRPLWFRGHWGFQYYAQEAGAVPWDVEVLRGRAGDLLAAPDNNYAGAPSADAARSIGRVDEPACGWAATMHPAAGAGFHACIFDWRPLPFGFADVPPQHVDIYRLLKDQSAPRPKN